MFSSVPLEASVRSERAHRVQHRGGPALIHARHGRDAAVGQRRARVATVGRGPHVGAHGHVGRDGVEAGLVAPAADGRMLGHKLAEAVAPLGGKLVDAQHRRCRTWARG